MHFNILHWTIQKSRITSGDRWNSKRNNLFPTFDPFFHLINIFFFNLCGETLGTAATTDLLYEPRMIGDGDCGEIGGMKIGRGKVKLPPCLTNYALRHEGVWGSGCIDPHFLDLGTSWRWVVSFTPRPLKYSEKTCSSATLSITNYTWLDPGLNPGRRDGKPETNRLSYGAAWLIPLSHSLLPLLEQWINLQLYTTDATVLNTKLPPV
jgi:hypothetical protein